MHVMRDWKITQLVLISSQFKNYNHCSNLITKKSYRQQMVITKLLI